MGVSDRGGVEQGDDADARLLPTPLQLSNREEMFLWKSPSSNCDIVPCIIVYRLAKDSVGF